MADITGLPRLASLIRSPGVVACRSADGRTLSRTFGHSDAVTSPVLPDSQMYGASLSKQVTGILVAQQCAQGALSPEAHVRDLLPEWPSWARDVTVAHLLHHMSGLPRLAHRSETWSNADVLAALREASGMATRPGSTFAYDNNGYVCLAEILSAVSRRPIQLLASELFTELGMSTSVLGSARHHPSGHVPPPRTVGDGGTGRRRIISHGGSWPTWTAKSVRRPGVSTSVVLLSASDEADAATDLCLLVLDRLG